MSKHETELRRRLASGEPLETVMRWYVACMGVEKWKGLSEFEEQFLARGIEESTYAPDAGESYKSWCRPFSTASRSPRSIKP
jgi:hypothetical protein